MTNKTKHYSNILIVAPDGQPLGSVGEKKIKFYIKGNLVDKVDPILGFDEVYRLKFEPEGRTMHQHHIAPRENRCVVTGDEDNLSLHHVVPYFIKKLLPEKYSDHTCHWCVLLNRDVHDKIEIMNETLYDVPLAKYIGNHPEFIDHKRIKQAVNTLDNIPYEYWCEFDDQRRYDICNNYLCNQGYATMDDERKHIMDRLRRKWVDQFIENCGGIEEMFLTYKRLFLTLEPKFLPIGYLEMEFE